LDFLLDASAGAFDWVTQGYSTKLAAAYFRFDVDCADFGLASASAWRARTPSSAHLRRAAATPPDQQSLERFMIR
jgi:hypothetical protein